MAPFEMLNRLGLTRIVVDEFHEYLDTAKQIRKEHQKLHIGIGIYAMTILMLFILHCLYMVYIDN